MKMNAVFATCSFKHILISIFCAASVVLSVFSVIWASPRNTHPLSIPIVSWRLSYHFNRGQDMQRHRGKDALELERILSNAAMPDKTVIITTLNEAWAAQNSMIDLFLESFRLGNNTAAFLNHLVIVALDQKAYDRCITTHMHCFKLVTEGVDFSGEKLFMSPDYLRMMWRRIDFLREILEEGYSFIFSDADIMWLRNPFLYVSADADFQMACDRFNGHTKSLKNRANGGFVYARANMRTIQFYRYWYMAKEVFPGMHDQDVFNKIKKDGALSEMGLKVEFFDTKHISGFCQLSTDIEKVATVHANCCYGLYSKLNDLRQVLTDWRRLATMTPMERRIQKFSWSAPRACLTSDRVLH